MSDTARTVAYRVLRRVSEEDAWANLALPEAVSRAGLGPRDAALATELVYGTLRMRGAVDWVLSLHLDRPLERLDPEVLDALRLGAYQLLYTAVPPYAAVSESVGLVPRKASGFVNAVLRRLGREKERIPWPTAEGDLVTYLRVRYSHPEWLVRLWVDELGPREAEGLLAAGNEVPPVGLRVAATEDPQAVLEELRAAGLDTRPGRWTPRAVAVRGGGAPSSWPGFAEGRIAVQDEASVLVGESVPAGERAVDLCAGPGGKTAQLAERAGVVAATDVHAHRARMVRDALERLRPSGRVAVLRADGRQPPVPDGWADAVLVDAPCSGLGVLRRRPEARWRLSPEDPDRLAALQDELLEAAVRLVRTGGTLVYAVCTVTRAETTEVTARLAATHPELRAEPVHPHIPRLRGDGPDLQLYPHAHGTDGMYMAAFVRTA